MIVAHNENYDVFQDLLKRAVEELQKDAVCRADYYQGRGGSSLEKDVYDFVNVAAKGTVFENNIELISGQKFPDIVAYVNQNQAYGLEVKTTVSNKWKSVGSSIFEGTRVDDVSKIHLLFGKLSDSVEFRCRRYEDCLYDVAITHSPRYLIDMETQPDETIFTKVGCDYETLRLLDNPFKPIKKYFRSRLNDGEELWWVDEKEENRSDLGIKLWGNLSKGQKEELSVQALAFFPDLLGHKPKKYTHLATWLVAKHGVVNHALRDTFTAGGKVSIDNVAFPKIFEHLINNMERIIAVINEIDEDDIEYYWKTPLGNQTKVSLWKALCVSVFSNDLSDEQKHIITEKLYGVR